MPDFEKCTEALRMQSFDALPCVPDSWMEVIKSQAPEIWTPPTERIRGGGGNTPSTPSTSSGSQGVDNPRANTKLVSRWASSGLNTVAALKDHWTGSGAIPYFTYLR